MDLPRMTLAAVVLCLTLSGCQTVLGPSEPPRSRTVTPAPVPAIETPTPTPPSNGRALGGVWPGQWSEFEPEPAAAYRDIRPTCERPPARVVHLQLGAILTANGTARGIETTLRFFAPSSRRSFGSAGSYAETFRTRYQPLLEADSVTYKPVERNGSVVVQPLRAHNNGSTTAYRWRVEPLSTASGEECWLTTAIRTGPAWTDSVDDETRRRAGGSDTVKSLAVNL